MKRSYLIKKLMQEGFTEKTLSNLGDRQLMVLGRKFLSEATFEVSADKVDMIKDKVKPEDVVRVSEEDDINEEGKTEDEVETWVLNLSESKYSNFTSKSEIMEIINSSFSNLDENELPDLLTFDAIVHSDTEVKPAPPKTTPGTKPGKPKIGPGIKPSPKPKALAEKK